MESKPVAAKPLKVQRAHDKITEMYASNDTLK